MTDFYCRVMESADLPAARILWKEVFHDAREYIDSFFKTLYAPGTGIAAVSGDDIIAQFFSIPGAMLIADSQKYTVSYLVALAASPKRRGGGVGSAVARETAALAFRQGADFTCLMPASDGLYGWYERAVGTKTLFYVREREFSTLDLPPSPAAPTPEKISAADYCVLREALLSGTPHARFGGRFPDWIAYEHRTGGLYRVGNSCAAVSLEGGMRIAELLCPESGFENIVGALSDYFGEKSCVARSPAFWGADETHGKIRPSVVALPRPGLIFPVMSNAYWGFTFE